MASIYDLKPKFQQLLQPATRALYRLGVTANQVTVAAMLVSLACGAWLAWLIDRQNTTGTPVGKAWLILPIYLFIRMALNAIDGMLARQYGMKSPLGAILNEAGDVVSDAALYLPFALLPQVQGGWVVMVVLLAMLGEMVGVLGATIGASRRYDGPFGKSDRAFVFGLLGLLLALDVPLAGWLTGIMMLCCALLLITIWKRSRSALAQSRVEAKEAKMEAGTQ
jgi:CDP-diacylglycerol--glycerol-3-phosphate 3-phosphatidyltransferase